MTAGETLEVTIEVERKSRFPLLYMFIRDQLDPVLTERKLSKGDVIYPLIDRKFEIKYDLVEMPRGVYQWNEITLQSGDPFGLVRRGISTKQTEEVVVYPRYQEIRYWKTLNERNMGMNQTIQRQAEDMTSVMGIRDYVPGDKLSRIHWKASAKTQTLRTKEFEHQATNDFMFFLDRGRSSYGSKSHLFEKAISLTASLVRFALKNHYSAGMVSYGDQEQIAIPMSKDQEQLFRIFEHLARISPDASFPLEQAILKEFQYLPTGTTVVVVTAHLSKELALLLGELQYRKIKVEFFWIRDSYDFSEEETSNRSIIEGIQISYHLIVGQEFEEAMTGGGLGASAIR